MISSIDLLDFKCFNLSPHRQTYLPPEILGNMWVSISTILIWYYRVITAHKTCSCNSGH